MSNTDRPETTKYEPPAIASRQMVSGLLTAELSDPPVKLPSAYFAR